MSTDLLPSWPLLLAFLGASFILAITPGPGVLYIVTRSLAQGRRSGLASVAGVALGNLGNAFAAAIGLAAWFAISTTAFSIVKYVGAAYLIYLGLKTFLAAQQPLTTQRLNPLSVQRVFRDGFFVALLNPKTTIFFAAFLPQFMGAHGASPQRAITLGSLFVLIAATTDTIYALAAGTVAPSIQENLRVRSIARHFSASVFLGLGLYTAISGRRARE